MIETKQCTSCLHRAVCKNIEEYDKILVALDGRGMQHGSDSYLIRNSLFKVTVGCKNYVDKHTFCCED